MRRWRRRRCARSARESARAGPGCGGWRCSTASAGSRSVSRACSSPCRRRTARRRSRRAGTRSTRSSGRCPSGRRSTSRTARSGWVSRGGSVVTLLERVERTIRRHAMLAGGECVLVAVSGGADSVALLVDHGLRADSARDAEAVRRLGQRLGVPVDVATVTVERRGSLEAAARAARYAALTACADRVGAARIALGHTADDQAETVLMRVLQGTGMRGLAGIPPVRDRIIRPLIECRHADLVAEVRRAGLEWVEDPSNQDRKFLRNRIRHEFLPWLTESYGPEMPDALVRVATAARATVGALDRIAASELERLAETAEGAVILPLEPLRGLPRDVAGEVLRQAAARLGSRAPLRAWAHRGLRRLLATPPPRQRFRIGAVTLEVSGARLRLALGALPPLTEHRVTVPGRLALPEIGRTLEATLS